MKTKNVFWSKFSFNPNVFGDLLIYPEHRNSNQVFVFEKPVLLELKNLFCVSLLINSLILIRSIKIILVHVKFCSPLFSYACSQIFVCKALLLKESYNNQSEQERSRHLREWTSNQSC